MGRTNRKQEIYKWKGEENITIQNENNKTK